MRMKVFALGFVCGVVVSAGSVGWIVIRSGQPSQASPASGGAIPATSVVKFEFPGLLSAPDPTWPPPDGQFPRGTQRREINGMFYYMVPCDSPGSDMARP